MSARIPAALRDEMRADWDKGDPFGSAMSWEFAIAETLHAAGEDVPGAWEFQPSPFVVPDTLAERASGVPDDCYSYADVVCAELYTARTITADEMRDAGNVLSRFVALCVALGVDY